MHSLGTHRSTRFCLRGQSGAPAAGSSIAAALRPCSSRRQHQQPRHLEAAASAGGESDKSPDEASLHLTPEEAAAYDALAAEKKAARQQTLQDAKRKRKFNPLHTKMKLTAAAPEDLDDDSTPPPPPAAAAAAPAAVSSNSSSGSSSGNVDTFGGAKFAARPRALPTGLKAALRQQQQQQVVTAAAARTAERPQHAPAAAAAAVKQVAPPSSTVAAAVGALGLEEDLAAELSQLLAAEDIPEVEALNPDEFEQAPQGVGAVARGPKSRNIGRKTPAEIAKAAAARRAQRQRAQERALQANARALVQQAEGEMEDEDYEAEDVIGDATGDDAAGALSEQQPGGQPAAAADPDDGLDWQALAQYEELENYLIEVKKEQQQQQNQQRGLGRKPAAAASKVQVPAALSAAAAAAQEKQSAGLPGSAPAAEAAAAAAAAPTAAAAAAAAAATPAAAAAALAATPATPEAAAPVAKQAPAASAAAAAPSTQQLASTKAAAQSPQQQQQQQQPVKKGKKARAKQVAKFEKDLDDLEELVNLFEAMQSSSSSSKQLAPKPSLPGSSSSRGGAAADDADAAGEALLASLLGKDWEAELLDDLAAVIDEGEEEEQQQQQQQQGQVTPAAAADADEDEQPWMDDITALLLGLVSISHQKYLNQPLPLPGLEAVTEEQRCGAFWEAPWGLLVLDDTAQNCVEYVNEAASKALGVGYLDVFGQSAVQLVDQGLEAQADWAFAVRQVEESASFSCTLPELQLVDASGRQVIARDVTLWRVDSLEDTPIGFAVLFKSCRNL